MFYIGFTFLGSSPNVEMTGNVATGVCMITYNSPQHDYVLDQKNSFVKKALENHNQKALENHHQ